MKFTDDMYIWILEWLPENYTGLSSSIETICTGNSNQSKNTPTNSKNKIEWYMNIYRKYLYHLSINSTMIFCLRHGAQARPLDAPLNR